MSGQAVEKDSYHSLDDPCVLSVQEAAEENRDEVVTFLSERPIHTFGMIGMILSNGLISPINRGTFYTCRNQEGKLEGIALIGYDNLFEAKSDDAIFAFAKLFQKHKNPHLLMGEEEKIDTFC